MTILDSSAITKRRISVAFRDLGTIFCDKSDTEEVKSGMHTYRKFDMFIFHTTNMCRKVSSYPTLFEIQSNNEIGLSL